MTVHSGAAIRDRCLSQTEVTDAIHRCANRLLGAGPKGGRVAIFAENSAETAIVHVAGLLAGMSTVPVNFHLAPAETAYILADSGTHILFVGPDTLGAGVTAAREASLDRVVGWGSTTIEESCNGWTGSLVGNRTGARRPSAASDAHVHVRHDRPSKGH